MDKNDTYHLMVNKKMSDKRRDDKSEINENIYYGQKILRAVTFISIKIFQ